MIAMNPKVDAFLGKAKKWQEEMEKLRTIALDCGLGEDLKWGKPCYTFQGTNLAIIQNFKEYCALMFFKGVLLQDADAILVSPGESQTARQIRFNNPGEIAEKEATIKAYIHEAIEVEKAGLKVEPRKTSDYPVPEEFRSKLDEMPALKTAFEGLTPGRQRAYLYYFAQPKQSKTRESRIEKYLEHILHGKGLND